MSRHRSRDGRQLQRYLDKVSACKIGGGSEYALQTTVKR